MGSVRNEFFDISIGGAGNSFGLEVVVLSGLGMNDGSIMACGSQESSHNLI